MYPVAREIFNLQFLILEEMPSLAAETLLELLLLLN